MEKSKTFELTNSDIKRWVRDIIVFLAPILIVMIENYESLGVEGVAQIGLSMFLSAIADLLRRFIVDYTQE